MGLVEAFKFVLASAISWSNTKLFEFENGPTPGTKSEVFRYPKFKSFRPFLYKICKISKNMDKHQITYWHTSKRTRVIR